MFAYYYNGAKSSVFMWKVYHFNDSLIKFEKKKEKRKIRKRIPYII